MPPAFEIELAEEAQRDLDAMTDLDFARVRWRLRRALGWLGREHLFGTVYVDARASKVWRTYEIPPYTVIFRFMSSETRRERGLSSSAHLVAAIPHQDRLDAVLRRLYEEADPDDSGWD